MSVENRFQELMSTFLSTTGLPKFERRHPVAPAGASRRKEMRRADAATGFWSLFVVAIVASGGAEIEFSGVWP